MSPSMTPILILPFNSFIVLTRIVVLPEPGEDIIFRQSFFCLVKSLLFLAAYSSFAIRIFLPTSTLFFIALLRFEFYFFKYQRCVRQQIEFRVFAFRASRLTNLKVEDFITVSAFALYRLMFYFQFHTFARCAFGNGL